MARRIINLIVAVGVLVGSLWGVSGAFADFDNMDTVMTISPPKHKIILVPGEDYSGSITVSNSSTAKKELQYSVSVGTYGVIKNEQDGTDYDIDLDSITGYNQIMDWIELKKDKGIVAINGHDVIPFVIHVPKDAPAGGQYATIIIQNDTDTGGTGDGGVKIEDTIRFASIIYAEVTGQTRETGIILENNIASFILNNQLLATSSVRNDGNVHTDAEYTLQVWPLFSDEEVCTNEEKEEGSKIEGTKTSLIMPETERYHAQTCYLPSIGIFRAVQTVKIFGETSVVERTVIFCPLWLLFVALFVIIALILWIVMKTRGAKKQKRTDDE